MTFFVGSSSKEWAICPVGTFSAICVDVIDKGMQEVTYKGETKEKHKGAFVFQIDEENPDTGKRFIIYYSFTVSSHENSGLRAFLKNWMGREMEPDELASFDLKEMVGKPAYVSITHSTDGRWANIGTIMPLPKGMTAFEPDDYARKQKTEDDMEF